MLKLPEFVWKKKGKVWDATIINLPWAQHSALTPTPIRYSKDIIRVYAGFRDREGISRIGYVDVSFHNPKEIIGISEKPCLDVGRDGCFDDNGAILGDVLFFNNRFHLYYVGFQKTARAKFLAFSGLAESRDGCHFTRVHEHPILDRDANANMINAIHSVHPIQNGNGYRVWHAKGDGWHYINGTSYPKYNIWTSTSADGIKINNDSVLCVDNQNSEYRIGRPSVYQFRDGWLMFYTKGTKSGEDYYPGIAISKDGIHWERRDELFGITLSSDGWDSRHVAYPRLLQATDEMYYVFYNGNDMGKCGFGYAELHLVD